MRHPALPTALFVLAVLYAPVALTDCHTPGHEGERETEAAPPPPVYLARGSCAGPAPGHSQLDCADPRAVARVLARYNGPRESGPRCPEDTDFVLRLAPVNAGSSEELSAPEGYACMRALHPPHPGDPGMGGGPLTVVGDCVYAERRGETQEEVKETACDGSQAHAPEYRIAAAARTRDSCPKDTDLYVQIGGGTPIGCARRLG
ncbi:hypothetical protein [Streptomyces orinoci]|uniref:Uncharacterized protein n=1 Tax=Streptomyces orinoci TaxID=67339 RepID=A0ABV3JQV3_STRON|nr:hypothetical protein [Streptomyces orinoci]